MTFMPAKRIGLAKRGQVKMGWFADLVVFDSETIIDRATFQNPHQYPGGIEWVLVNGKIALANGDYRDSRSGRVLRKEIP